jgi:hypothetical protein
LHFPFTSVTIGSAVNDCLEKKTDNSPISSVNLNPCGIGVSRTKLGSFDFPQPRQKGRETGKKCRNTDNYLQTKTNQKFLHQKGVIQT